jgi:hypothetical protein
MSVILEANSDSVTLPNPVLGDRELNDQNLVLNRNRSSEPMIRGGLTTETHNFNFIGLTRTEVSNAVTFLGTYAGQAISLTNYNGVTVSCVILNPEITRVTVRDTCSYDLSFIYLEI